jgi:hypothetical protein
MIESALQVCYKIQLQLSKIYIKSTVISMVQRSKASLKIIIPYCKSLLKQSTVFRLQISTALRILPAMF